MICPWPPTPIFRLAFSGAPPVLAAPPAAGAVAEVGGLLAAPPHAVVSTSASARTIDLCTSFLLRGEQLARGLRLPPHQAPLDLCYQHFYHHDHDAQHQHAAPHPGRVEVAP